MSTLGLYDMSFPGLAVSGGQSQGSSSGTSSGSSSGSGQSQQSTQIVPGMLNVYQQLLGANEQNYGNMLNAYQGQKQENNQTQQQINQGYNALGTGVMNTLGLDTNGQPNGSYGVAAPAAQSIGNTYNQQVATNQQQMTNAGLGNTTVGANANNQAAQAAALSYGQLGAQLAQTAAGYQAQIGQAGLGAQMQGMQTQTGLTQGALNPLDTQYANTAGALTGGFGNSSYSNNSTQQSKQGSNQQSQQGQSGNTGASDQNPAGNVAGAPGGPAGGGGSGGGGGGGDGSIVSGPPAGTGSGVAGTNPYGAGNPTGSGAYSQGNPGGQQTLSPTDIQDQANSLMEQNPDLSSDDANKLAQVLPPGASQGQIAAAKKALSDGRQITNIKQVSDTAVVVTFQNPGQGGGSQQIVYDSKS